MRLALFGLLSMAVALVGCGGSGDTPELGTVEGTVTLDGKPLANATVTFIPQDTEQRRPSNAQTNESGEFELKYSREHDGAPPGKYLVEIRTGGGEDDDVVKESVPANYNTNSELVRDVKSGHNEFEFKLESSGTIDDGSEGSEAKKENYCE